MQPSTMNTPYDVLVVGAGITGLSACKRLLAAGARVANVEAHLFGGLVTNVNELEGAYEGSGADLAASLMLEIGDLGCITLSEAAMSLQREGRVLVLATDSGRHEACAVIVATGARLKRLGVPGEAELEYRGVSQCADCDGPIAQGEDVVVAGGGDSALQEALVLARFCRTVHVVHHHAAPTARAEWVARAKARPNVRFVPNAEIEAIEGDEGVERVRVRSPGGAAAGAIACRGVFGYVGLEPASAFLPRELARDAHGALVTDERFATALPGVFAAGAVRAEFGGTLGDAVREGNGAADAALAWLRSGADLQSRDNRMEAM